MYIFNVYNLGHDTSVSRPNTALTIVIFILRYMYYIGIQVCTCMCTCACLLAAANMKYYKCPQTMCTVPICISTFITVPTTTTTTATTATMTIWREKECDGKHQVHCIMQAIFSMKVLP